MGSMDEIAIKKAEIIFSASSLGMRLVSYDDFWKFIKNDKRDIMPDTSICNFKEHFGGRAIWQVQHTRQVVGRTYHDTLGGAIYMLVK